MPPARRPHACYRSLPPEPHEGEARRLLRGHGRGRLRPLREPRELPRHRLHRDLRPRERGLAALLGALPVVVAGGAGRGLRRLRAGRRWRDLEAARHSSHGRLATCEAFEGKKTGAA